MAHVLIFILKFIALWLLVVMAHIQLGWTVASFDPEDIVLSAIKRGFVVTVCIFILTSL